MDDSDCIGSPASGRIRRGAIDDPGQRTPQLRRHKGPVARNCGTPQSSSPRKPKRSYRRQQELIKRLQAPEVLPHGDGTMIGGSEYSETCDLLRWSRNLCRSLSKSPSALTPCHDFPKVKNRLNESNMVSTDVGSLLLVVEQGMRKVLAEAPQTYQPVQPHPDPAPTEVYTTLDLNFFRSPESPPSRIRELPPKSTHEIGSKATDYRTLPLIPEALEYLEGDIPEPPAEIGLDVYQLSTIWNDSWPTWKNVSPLMIKSRPVPLMHLRCVYGGTGHWKHLKQQWSKCNFLMTEYESLGPEDFWEKWTVQGHKIPPSKILDSLAKDRKERERADARAAEEAYVTNFQELFSYKKGGKTYMMVSDKAISRRFRELCGHDQALPAT